MSQAGRIISVDTRHYPMASKHCQRNNCEHLRDPSGDGWCGDPPPVRAVLVAGDIGDYACYVGIGDADWVARHGDKISFAEAVCHFPTGLKKELYRD